MCVLVCVHARLRALVCTMRKISTIAAYESYDKTKSN
jgi:hypothetical protein